MPGFLLHLGATVKCTHAAPVTIAPAQASVLVKGKPVATVDNSLTVAGCPFQVPAGPGPKPQPCVTVKWGMVSARVLIKGKPALLQAGPGTGVAVCQSAEQIPQGAPVVAQMQGTVIGG